MIKIIDALSALEIKDFVVYGNPKNETEFIKMFRKVIGKEENANAILSEDPNSFGVTWSQVAAKKLELEAAEPMRLLRIERDKKLQESDWRATIDYQGTKQSDWLTYRQALRDLPTNTEDAKNPIWPTPPESD